MRRAEDLHVPGEARQDAQLKCPASRVTTHVWHILAPTDLSSESRKSIKYAMRLAQHFQAKLTLLHVCEMPDAGTDDPNAPASEEFQQHSARAKLSLLSLHDVVRAQYSNTEPCFRCGEPGEQIVATARSLGVDLIVFSTHDFAWLRHFVDGGDAQKILRAAPCQVLIVHEHRRADSPAVPLVKSEATADRTIRIELTGPEAPASRRANTAGWYPNSICSSRIKLDVPDLAQRTRGG